jgi:hypothetical protein
MFLVGRSEQKSDGLRDMAFRLTRMQCELLTFIILIALVPPLASSPPSKPAWQWTVDERLAVRFDEKARSQRIDDYSSERVLAQARRSGHPTPDVARPAEVLRGSQHPELLMPFEIFSSFTRAAYGEEDATARTVRDSALRKAVPIGLPADFLETWQSVAHGFITLQREELNVRQAVYTGKSADVKRDTERIRELERLACQSRTKAMRELRTRFGARFDEFLYRVAAPNVTRILGDPGTADQLRSEEEGCQ